MFDGKYENDQLRKIFKLLGTPDNSTWENVESYPCWNARFPKHNNEGQLQKLLADKLSPHQIELVVRMFEYNPRKRISMDEVVRLW